MKMIILSAICAMAMFYVFVQEPVRIKGGSIDCRNQKTSVNPSDEIRVEPENQVKVW